MKTTDKMAEAAQLVRTELEAILSDVMPEVAALAGTTQRTSVVIGTELMMGGLQFLALAEPDEDEYIGLVRGFAVLDDNSLRQLHRAMRLK